MIFKFQHFTHVCDVFIMEFLSSILHLHTLETKFSLQIRIIQMDLLQSIFSLWLNVFPPSNVLMVCPHFIPPIENHYLLAYNNYMKPKNSYVCGVFVIEFLLALLIFLMYNILKRTVLKLRLYGYIELISFPCTFHII